MNSNKAHNRFVSVVCFLSPLILCSLDACFICISCPTRFQSPGSAKSNSSSRFLSWACSSVYHIISFLFPMTAICKIHHFSNLTYPCVTYNFVRKRYCIADCGGLFICCALLPDLRHTSKSMDLNILYWKTEI